MQIEFNFNILGEILTPEDKQELEGIYKTSVTPDEFRERYSSFLKKKTEELKSCHDNVLTIITGQFKDKLIAEIDAVLER